LRIKLIFKISKSKNFGKRQSNKDISGAIGDFDETAIPIYLGSIPLVLLTAMLVAWIYADSGRLLLIATALSASDAVFELIALVVTPFAGRVVILVLLAWLWLVSVRAVIVCGNRRRPQLLKGVLAVTAMLAVGYFAFPRTEVWVAPAEERAPDPLAEERLFHLLIAVSGVGPRLAQTILSGMPASELAEAIIANEIARLTQISGVGKKTAERLVMELKDKLKTAGLPGRTPAPAIPLTGSGALVSALLNLGYKPSTAERTAEAVRRSLGPAAAVEEQLREALRLISGAA